MTAYTFCFFAVLYVFNLAIEAICATFGYEQSYKLQVINCVLRVAYTIAIAIAAVLAVARELSII